MKSVVALALFVSALSPVAASAQQKKPITQDVYDIWRSIQGSSLSPDGKWAAYTMSPAVGDGEVVVHATAGASEYRAPRGFTGRPVLTVTQDTPFVATPAQFTADSRFVAFTAYAPKSDYDRVRTARRGTPQPRLSLTLISLADGKVTTVPRVRSFRLARESGNYLVYLTEPADSARAAAARDSTAPRPAPGEAARPREKRKDPGSTLVIRTLASGNEEQIADVSSYTIDDSAHYLVYATSSKTGEQDGVYLRGLAAGPAQAVLSGQGNYKQLAVDRAGSQLAFVSDRDDYSSDKPKYTLYYTPLKTPKAQPIAVSGGFGPLLIADRGRLEFTRDGGAIIFPLAPLPIDSIPADSLADKAVFDLWNWKDPHLQPQQKVEANRERNRTFAAIYQIKAHKALQLGNDSLPQVQVSENGRVALGITNVPYQIESMWGEGGTDVYLIDVATGKRTQIASRLRFPGSLSPEGKYALYFDDKHWWSVATATGKKTDLTGGLKGMRFDEETWDTPSTPAPWGTGGWTKGDQSVLLYDRYDVWDVDPSGARAPRVVTDSVGRKNHIVFRVVDLDREDPSIDPAEPLLLRAFDSESKASGFYRDRLGAATPPERLVMGDRAYGVPQKARRAETLMLTQSTVAEFPNLWAGPAFDRLTKISDANPQQRDYPWPSVELVNWLSDDGVALKGMLYKPQGFDSSKKYPMIVYYYETLSDGLHNYHAPTGRNVINPTVYTSLGYLVFFPDIVYTPGWPGPSAVKCIVPGVKSLIGRGFVDPKAIGLAGQSWGGYQTAYLITQTSLFAAAVPNAPVANMTSAYGGIRWGSGLAREFQYEKTQSRIGGSLWEYPVRYIENSPLFHLDRVTTPVFFMQNDADDAVPWYQGIELFLGLRRLGKEVYFIVYNGDVHNPRKRANQKDVDMRMQQFFANKLKGEPAPDWMVHGIPYLQKGRDQLAKPKAADLSAGAAAPAGGTKKQ